MTECIKKHFNSNNAKECTTCHLPIVDYRGEINILAQLLSSKSVFARPKVSNIFYGIGGRGNIIVQQLQTLISSSRNKISFCYFDSSNEDLSNLSKGDTSIKAYKVGSTNTGGTVYCGLGEIIAACDNNLKDEILLSGCREPDADQILFFVSALGGGTGSGVCLHIVATCKRINPKATNLVVAVLPSSNEPAQAHFNAYYAISNILTIDKMPLTDLLFIIDYDRLRQTRGVGKGGSELRMEHFLAYLLKLIGINFSNSNFLPISKMAKGLGIQVVVPCLAIGRSMDIFGNLTNILESALIIPLASLETSTVTLSCLLLSIPRRLAHMFPPNNVTDEFQGWNKKHFPRLRASMFHIAQTEDLSDRIDCCILLGGNGLDTSINKTKVGYVDFKGYLEKSGQWSTCGLTPEKLLVAENKIKQYDTGLQ